MKKRVNIYLDRELVEKAHSLGLNISRIAENALKQAINRIDGANSKKETISKTNLWWGRPELVMGLGQSIRRKIYYVKVNIFV